MTHQMSINAAIAELEEMFPNHRTSTIEHALQIARGNFEHTVTVLLKTKPDKITERQRRKPAPVRDNLLFPETFLRWPSGIEYVKVMNNEESNSLIEDTLPPPADLSPQLDDRPLKTLKQDSRRSDDEMSRNWREFKSRLLN